MISESLQQYYIPSTSWLFTIRLMNCRVVLLDGGMRLLAQKAVTRDDNMCDERVPLTSA